MTPDETLRFLTAPMQDTFLRRGITMESLARDLKRHLRAKATKTLKVKGAAGDLPKGFRCVTTTGLTEHVKVDGETEKDYTDGESVIQWSETDHGVQLKAWIEAAKILNLYPAEKRSVEFPDENGKPQKIGAVFSDTERSARLLFLLEEAEKRAKKAKKCSR